MRAGRDKHERRKIHTISTILKYQSTASSLAPRFPRGQRKTLSYTDTNQRASVPNRPPFLFLLFNSLQITIKQMGWGIVFGRGNIKKCDADVLASEAVDTSPSLRKASISVGCLVKFLNPRCSCKCSLPIPAA